MSKLVLVNKNRHVGAALVELALVILFFLVPFVFGSIELGRALIQQNQVSQRVDVAARFLSRGENLLTAPPACGAGAGWSDALNRSQDMLFYGEPIDPGGLSTFFPNLIESDFTLSITATAITGVTDVVPGCVIRVAVSGVPFNSIFGGSSIVPLLEIAPIRFSASSEVRYVRDF
jgi:hypothetical protein